MSANTPEEVRNEQVIRSLYALAEGNAKDTSRFRGETKHQSVRPGGPHALQFHRQRQAGEY
jgi:hypothetical protein